MVDNIITLAGHFSDTMELQAYCDKQYVALQTAQERIKSLEAEVAHLKELLVGAVPLEPKIEKLQVSNEQAICEMQITRLLKTASERDLTLEETKRLDILTKNLYLSKGQSTAIITDFTKLPSNVSEAALIELASTGDDESSG